MPIYEYECEACGHRSEAIQRLSEDPLNECLECGGAIRRLISAPAVQFKGTGWYVTDYAGRKGSDGSADASESKKESPSTESKAKAEKSTSQEGSKASANVSE